VPILAPGDIVVMDNLGSHNSRAVRAAIRAAKAKLFFLPAYSPDLNPIEQAFAKMKTLLRKADARTIDQTWRTIGALLDCFTPTECANYFKNAGMLQPNQIALYSTPMICSSVNRARFICPFLVQGRTLNSRGGKSQWQVSLWPPLLPLECRDAGGARPPAPQARPPESASSR
jgi:hypothetical protein